MTIRIFFPLGSHPATGANNRLASDGTFRYLYDNEGNRTRRFVDGNASGTLDAGDTQITEYAWDHRDRLLQVTSRAVYGGAATRLVAYTYDVFDHVIARNHDADGAGPQGMQPTFYAYDGDQIILEFNGVQATNLTHRYLWGPAVDQLLADEQVSSLNTPGNVIWPLSDNLGTTRDLAVYDALTDTTTVANHRVYDAYGNLKSETNAAVDELFGYTGRMFDESTGLQNNWERWYDPKVGSWLSEDPIGFEGGDGNLKRYVGNSVTNIVDPVGLAGVGHHYLPQEVIEALQKMGILTEEAYHYGLGYYSGQTYPNHNFGTYGGYTHGQYNKKVIQEALDYAAKNKITAKQPMTCEQMEAFIKNNLINSNDPIISGFNKAIAAQRGARVAMAKRPGALRPPADMVDAAEIVRRGKSFKGTQSWLAGRSAGVAIGSLMGLLADTVEAMDAAGRPDSAFAKAYDALARGNLDDADRWMRGSRVDTNRTGFYDELLRVGATVAMNFDNAWVEIVTNARCSKSPYPEK